MRCQTHHPANDKVSALPTPQVCHRASSTARWWAPSSPGQRHRAAYVCLFAPAAWGASYCLEMVPYMLWRNSDARVLCHPSGEVSGGPVGERQCECARLLSHCLQQPGLERRADTVDVGRVQEVCAGVQRPAEEVGNDTHYVKRCL